ncbi:MAG: hypothetical protein MK135_08670, partial [Polyangiaceae bacterium]|nr:hypothetical protein [Polyangiaceae bacterium]
MYPSRKFNLAEEILPIVNLPQLVPVRRLVLGALTFFSVGIISTFLVASRDQLECEEKTCEFSQRFLGFSSSMRRFSAHKLHVKMVQDFIVRSGKNHVTLYKLKVFAPGVAFDLFPKEERSDAPHLVATQAALQRV